MQNPQEVFNKIQTNKAKLKDLKMAYKNALETANGYKDVTEQLKALREKKKQIETMIKQDFKAEISQMEDLQIDISSDKEMLSDIILSMVMKGEAIKITDIDGNEYEPALNATVIPVK